MMIFFFSIKRFYELPHVIAVVVLSFGSADSFRCSCDWKDCVMMLRPSSRVLGPCLGIIAIQYSDLTIIISVQRGGMWVVFFFF